MFLNDDKMQQQTNNNQNAGMQDLAIQKNNLFKALGDNRSKYVYNLEIFINLICLILI